MQPLHRILEISPSIEREARNAVHFSSATGEWETPQALYDELARICQCRYKTPAILPALPITVAGVVLGFHHPVHSGTSVPFELPQADGSRATPRSASQDGLKLRREGS